MIHNEQLDLKNEKIESLMIENDSLQREILNLKEIKAK